MGEDATLSDVIQTLDEHYGVVMIFDALNKELYSLKQGMGENVAEFRACISQQVQILQMEYLSRIQQEHVEEVKWDYFYKGFSPKYQWMLAHKVSGENPVTCSELLLTAQKLERWAEARDPLVLKTATAGNLNIAHSHPQGNLFPSRRLKGNHTFTAWSTVVENHETEEDSDPKPNGEKHTESSAEEDVGTLGTVGDADLSLGYIAVELYQMKNWNCFGCGNPDHLVKDCPKDLGKTTRKVGLNLKEGRVKKGGQFSQKSMAIQQATPGGCFPNP